MLTRLAFPTTFVVALLAMAGTASAGNIKVTTTLDELDASPDATCSLREAISTANDDVNTGGCTDPNNGAADTVSLSGADYGLTRTAFDDNNSAGDLDVTEALTIKGAGADLTGIDGNGEITGDRVLHHHAGTLTVQGLRVYGGDASTGGGILSLPIGAQSLRLIDSQVTGNSGNGITGGGVALTRSTVSGNDSPSGGGGISANTLKLTDSAVTGNSANGLGGGVFVAGPATLVRSTVADNRANGTSGAGGGIFGGTTNITDSRVVRNRAASTSNGGGGVLVFTGGLTVTRSTVSGNNSAGLGGGVLFSSSGALSVINSTLSGNTAAASGGGFAIDKGTATINNATISRNLADADESGGDDGGGLFQTGTGVLKLRNSLLAENATLGGSGPDCAGTLTAPSYDAFTALDSACAVTPVASDVGVIVGGSPIGALADNGGLTPTHALLAGNAAINAGYPGSGAGVPCATTDQRGLPRGGAAGRCDIGAFEVQP